MYNPKRASTLVFACFLLSYTLGAFVPAVKSRVDNEDLVYWSHKWESGDPFNDFPDTDGQNAIFPAFKSVYVNQIRLTLNDITFTWSLS